MSSTDAPPDPASVVSEAAAPASPFPEPASLAEQKERLELVLEGTRLGMWDWNPQTNDVVFDERWAEMLGHSLDEIPFTLESWSSRVHPDDLEGCFADIQAHMEGRVPFYENIHRMRHKDGRWVYILDRGRVCAWDEEGRPVRFTGTHTDITTQKEAELRARELAQGRTHFLATMSHEIRTPMHGMLGLVGLLERSSLDQEQRRILTLLRQSGESLTRLIDDVLDFSKASEGQLSLRLVPVRVRSLLREVVGLFEARTEAKGVVLRCVAPAGLPHWVEGDRHRLRQVLSNLVSNAVKFTRVGSIELRAFGRDGGVRFEVADTGPGIADTRAIFEPYNQAEAAGLSATRGTGLGLAIVHELATAMGGSVTVTSELGVGSCFVVDLPLSPCRPPEMQPEQQVSRAGLDHISVVAAEDNVVNQTILEALLGPVVGSLQLVSNGREAVELVQRCSPDVVLMDLNMPELDGDEATRQLRRLGLELPIVATTADVLPETRDRCRAVGFTAFLSKPFSEQKLLEVLREVVGPGPAED